MDPVAQPIPFNAYLFLSTLLFCMGVFGVLFRRNGIIILMCIELMLNSVNLLLVAISSYFGQSDGQVFVFFKKDFALAVGIRKVGEPVHAMQLRLTIDEELNVIDAAARSEWVPYPGHCDSFGDAYRQLVGLNLLRGFRHAVQQRLTAAPRAART